MRTRSFTSALVVSLLLVLPLHGAFSQEEGKKSQIVVYSLGQQTIAISAGLFIPLFFQSFDGTYSDTTNLALGGCGSLMWGIHLNNHWLVGLEVAGIFSRSVQKNFLYQVPIVVRGSYSFHIFPFEFPVYLGLGMDIVKIGGAPQTQVNFIMKPGFSALWKYNISWGFGLNAVYWWVPQPWKENKGRMGNFLDVTLTAQYSF